MTLARARTVPSDPGARGPAAEPPARSAAAALAPRAAWSAAALLVVLLALVSARLPWVGDLGMHAATLERLRHDLLHPGNPLVAEDTPSPYYSPWTVLLATAAELGGPSTFGALRVAAAVGLGTLLSGVWRFARVLTDRLAAVPVALLCLTLLWGTDVFAWSGFTGLGSLALTVSYPSTLALGLAFHLWAWLWRALAGRASWPVFLWLGLLVGAIVLVHQFTGVVAGLGALALVLGARPRPDRAVWARLLGGGLLGAALVVAWPYYDVLTLLGTTGLDEIHRSLYGDPVARFGLAALGVLALAARWGRDRRDPLVLFFALGLLVVVLGGASGHHAWGRALPAVLIPAQLAAAVEAFGAGRRSWRTGYAVALAGALGFGAWAQSGTLGYVVPPERLPAAVAAKAREPWHGYRWITPWVRYGDVVMARTHPARQIPAHGPYTVAPGYPDVLLPDAARRGAAVERYYAPGTGPGERARILADYRVRWVLDAPRRPADGLREVAVGPGGERLYRVGP
ncbi:hypothetical protein ACFWIA_22150 [Streptomyces sp. NPDC127068]|uniref:hypothetical protein n=1 Tax=Streptomyces sp. NPDC127068 TaxID=3347127 RepID=UPI00364DAD2C